MKKHCGKRIVSLLLALLLAAAVLPPEALALEPEFEPESGPVIDANDPLDALSNREERFSAAYYTADFVDYRAQLTARQKAFYDVMNSVTIDDILSGEYGRDNSGKPYYMIKRTVPSVSGAQFSHVVSSDNKLVRSPAADKLWGEFGDDFRSARMALQYDHSEYLWNSSISIGYSLGNKISNYVYPVTTISFYYFLSYEGRERTMYNSMMSNARYIANAVAGEKDLYSKLKRIHDILAINNTYAYGPDGEAVSSATSPLSYSPYSALIPKDQWEPVCQGYACAFKIVCDLAGIPCTMAVSKDHRWNNVKMDDDRWYNIDVTWDDNSWDSSGKACYTYFLIGSETQIRGTPFNKQESHVEVSITERYEEVNPGYKYQLLRYPTKNKVAYEYLGHDYPQPTFKDVPRSLYCYDAVEWAVNGKITKGTGSGAFSPNKVCNRGEAVTFLWRAAGSPEPTSTVSPFIDVSNPKEYYYKAVLWAVENKITKGTSATTFSPQKTCDRSTIVTFQYRAAGSPEVTSSPAFDDVQPGQFYTDAVAWAVENKITKGVSSAKFGPAQDCQRGQIVTFLYRQYVES